MKTRDFKDCQQAKRKKKKEMRSGQQGARCRAEAPNVNVQRKRRRGGKKETKKYDESVKTEAGGG